jgi:glycosyltransferase involved in cell wall biosynthesis
VPGNEFQAALGSADILLVNERPGVAEMSVPSKLTSYFCTGLPVLGATDDGSVTASELEKSGGGIRVDAGAPAALLDGISLLAGNGELRSELGAAGLRYRESALAPDLAIDRYAEWLEGLAARTDRK